MILGYEIRPNLYASRLITGRDCPNGLHEQVCTHSKCEVHFFSYAGGPIPYLAARFAIIDEWHGKSSEGLGNPVLRMLRDGAGIDQKLINI